MTKDIDDRDVDDRLELAQKLVSNPGAQDWCEVTEAGERVVDSRGLILGVSQLFLQIQRQDGLHPIVRKSLTKLISHNEEDTEGIPQLEHKIFKK